MAGRVGVLLWTGGLMAFVAILFTRYYDPQQVLLICPSLQAYLQKIGFNLDTSKNDDVAARTEKTPSHAEKLFTSGELSEYDGTPQSRGLKLSILGQVFDVSRGQKHYGPGGAYHHFAGRDATKSFVTGEFAPEELTEDVTGLKPDEMLELDSWLKFYQKDYKFEGKLVGHYYDASGDPTEALRKAEEAIAEGHRQKHLKDDERHRFPGCNSEWEKAKGGRVWCSTRSGGVERDWVGVPRQLFNPTTGETRCVCVHPMEVSNPNLKEFPNCLPKEPSCNLKEDDLR